MEAETDTYSVRSDLLFGVLSHLIEMYRGRRCRARGGRIEAGGYLELRKLWMGVPN